ncbi:hypothetical protein [Paenibacillus humicola]|nr:hypothetical protein [Paenibacillus humicola]
MRALLMTMLLVVVVITLYTNITGGDEGTKALLERSGSHMANSIRRMNP